jgi:hypothetical protein
MPRSPKNQTDDTRAARRHVERRDVHLDAAAEHVEVRFDAVADVWFYFDEPNCSGTRVMKDEGGILPRAHMEGGIFYYPTAPYQIVYVRSFLNGNGNCSNGDTFESVGNTRAVPLDSLELRPPFRLNLVR